MDESWYANVSYNFVQGNGLVDTVAQDSTPWVTFFYPFIMGLFFKVFGTTVWMGRFVSVLAGSIALAGFFQIQRLWKIKPLIILVTGILFIISNVYYVVFRTIRPEAWCVAFAIWGFFFLARGAQKNRSTDFMLSALLTSFGVMCHLNGVLYALLYGLFVFGYSYRNKKVGFAVGYAGIGVMCGLAWLAYYTILCKSNLMDFLTGTASARTIAGEDSMLNAVWHAFETFAFNYSLGLKRVFIFVFEIGVLVAGLSFWKRDRRLFFTALNGLLFFLIALVFFQPFATRHFGEVLFFVLLTVSLLLQQVDLPKLILAGVCLMVTLYGLNNLAGTAYLVFRDCRNTSFYKITAELEQQIPAGAKVISLMPFWFGLMDTDFYSESTRWSQKGYESLNAFLLCGEPDYVILSPYLLEGKTGTSGRKELTSSASKLRAFYEQTRDFSKKNGSIVSVVETKGYDRIEIWKINACIDTSQQP
ncbi:glycosyltransferase family 39 protein [Pontiella sulfatireligans]|nr:glycosyltransferase family 39 protein [Pontiella sulfatireligans]